jgi:hypothetical protein
MKSLSDKLFASLQLPVLPAVAFNGAAIQVFEPTPEEAAVPAFFGGYADDLLGDLGFDLSDDAVAELDAAPASKHL